MGFSSAYQQSEMKLRQWEQNLSWATYNSQFVTLSLSDFAEWLMIYGEGTSISFLNKGNSVGWLSENRSNMVLLIITITISSNLIGALTASFFTNHSVGL